jgi:DNA-binding PadR family transcriptional regulator
MFDNNCNQRGHGAGGRRRARDFEELRDRLGGRHHGPAGHRHGPGGFDPAAWLGRGMGPGRGLHAFMGGFGRGPMARRGEVRPAILAVLADGPMHGYQVMQELKRRSGGVWAPSAGSVYPTLQQLEDEGLVHPEERDGRRVYTLTDEGRAEAAKTAGGAAPWENDRGRADLEFGVVLGQVAQAAMQVYHAGSPAAVEAARKSLIALRRELYGLLAADGLGDVDDATGEPADGQGHGA